MKKQAFLTALLLCSAFNLASAQGIFKVIASSGATTKDGAPVKIGAQVASSDQLVVGAKSYLGLSYGKGGTVQISKAGTYAAKDLEAKLLASSKTSSQKYADFIIGEVVKNGDVNIHKNPYAYQKVTGSVERSTPTIGKTKMTVYLFTSNPCLADEYTFQWKPVEGVSEYTVFLKDNFDVVFKKETVKGTSYRVNFKDLGKDFFKVSIATNANAKQKQEYSLDKEKAATFLPTLNKYKASLGQDIETVAQKQLDIAVFLEENGFMLDAQLAYQNAVKLEPSNEIFTVAYNQFLLRTGMGELDPKTLAKQGEEE